MLKNNLTKGRVRHLPIILVAVHLVLILIALCQVEYHGGGLHPINQPMMVQILIIVNFPAMLFAGMLVIPVVLNVFGLHANETTLWLQVALFIVCASLQWWLLGLAFRRVFASKAKQSSNDIEPKS
ncbi:MAG: hypothetical protein KA746_10440 [Pyrinomonadaceae bacterium]|nr:hypothetical protein [Pyrinomonadaceae bacterium]MBP6212290.1 hypothetical protein [Pyrinomonadaceae bacterium]